MKLNTCTLQRVSKATKGNPKRKIFMARWWEPTSTKPKRRGHVLGDCARMTLTNAKKELVLLQVQVSNGDMIEQPAPEPVTAGLSLSDFRTFYLEKRARGDAPRSRRLKKKYSPVAASTLDKHDMTFRYLIEFFGSDCLISAIRTEQQIDDFLEALENGELASARQWHRHRETKANCKGYSEHTLRGFVRSLKTIFGWAKAHDHVTIDPTENHCGTPLPSDDKEYITLEAFKSLARASGDNLDLKVFLGLCRLGGLRVGTAFDLPWSGTQQDGSGKTRQVGVDFDRGCLCLVSKKTGGYREAPLHPWLEDLLKLHRQRMTRLDGVPIVNMSRSNLHKRIARLAKRAGLKPWPKAYQALRASRREDLKEIMATMPDEVNQWIGHGAKVGEKHYGTTSDWMLKRVRAVELDTLGHWTEKEGPTVIGMVA